PSGSVIWYCSPGTGLPSSSSNSISIQCGGLEGVVPAAELLCPASTPGLKGLIGVEPYLPVFVCSCSCLTLAISPGSALSASSATLGSMGGPSMHGIPTPGGEPGPELIRTMDP